MRAHEAGALHADGYRGPTWLHQPQDVNALHSILWASSVGRSTDGVLAVGGVSVTDLAQQFGTPAYVVDEADFRGRAAEFVRTYSEIFDGLCGGADVYYAGKAFLCTEIARWIRDDGLFLDVCSGGELAVAIRAGMPGARIGMHGNNKSLAELEAAVDYGVGRIIVDSFEEIDRLAAIAARLGRSAPVLVRVTVGVEAHTHEFIATAHEDQKFGFSLATGDAAEAVRRILAHAPHLRLLGLHSHIGSQIFDTSGYRGVGPADPAPARPGRPRARDRAARARPRRRLRHRLHERARPVAAQVPGRRDGRDRRPGVPGQRRCRAADLDRARPRDRRPQHLHPLRGRHGQAGPARRRRQPQVCLRRRGDE
jgi:D-serine deaminase-like pyridoxal phosphate-dependent protein